MHWSRAAQGYLPWRHTSQWVPPKPELPAPVIVTPEPEAEEAAPRFRVGQVWRTRGGVECTVVHIRSDYLSQFPIYTDLYGDHHHSISGKSILRPRSYGEDHEDDLVELISEPSAPEPPASPAPEPTPASPEPEPEKATRGFLEFTRVRYQDGFIDCAIGTDHTAFIRFSAVRCFSEPDWVQVRPLPQPGEE
jgi:hypothetical protein